MSLDVYLNAVRECQVFHANVTHNLNKMAMEAGIYEVLWRPDENGIVKSGQLIPFLEAGIKLLEAEPERFKKLNPENGWGDYDGFVKWCKRYLSACVAHPDAIIEVSR